MGDWLVDEESELLGEALSLLVSWEERGEPQRRRGEDAQGVAKVASATAIAETVGIETRTPSQFKSHAVSESGSSSDDAHANIVTVATKSTVKRPRRVNATRERRKTEIELLRGESAQLQSQLFALQQRREEMLRPHYSGQAIQSTAPIWENMTRRQFQSRRRTEEYNVKLRAKVAEQAQVTEELMNAIQLAMQRQTLKQKAPNVRAAIDISQRLSEEQQLQRLEEQFPRWQWALSLSPRFEDGDLEFLDFYVGSTDGFTATMDAYTSYALPATLETVTRVGWTMLKDEPGDNFDDVATGETYVHDVQSDNNLIISAFDSTCTMGGEVPDEGVMCGKWVGRRVMHSAYHVMTMHWHYELKDFDNELDGVSVEEVIWVRTVDARHLGLTQIVGPLTVQQQVRRLQFDFNEKEPVARARVERVAYLFQKQIEDELDMFRRLIENTLVGL